MIIKEKQNLNDICEGNKSEWISVEDKLPKSWEIVLVCTKHNTIEMNMYSAIGGWKRNAPVTHWMPLPNPPKMKGE